MPDEAFSSSNPRASPQAEQIKWASSSVSSKGKKGLFQLLKCFQVLLVTDIFCHILSQGKKCACTLSFPSLDYSDLTVLTLVLFKAADFCHMARQQLPGLRNDGIAAAVLSNNCDHCREVLHAEFFVLFLTKSKTQMLVNFCANVQQLITIACAKGHDFPALTDLSLLLRQLKKKHEWDVMSVFGCESEHIWWWWWCLFSHRPLLFTPAYWLRFPQRGWSMPLLLLDAEPKQADLPPWSPQSARKEVFCSEEDVALCVSPSIPETGSSRDIQTLSWRKVSCTLADDQLGYSVSLVKG